MKSMNQILKRYTQSTEFVSGRDQAVHQMMNYPEIKAFIESHALPQEVIENSYSRLHEYMLEMEALKRGESGQNPGFAPVLFLHNNYIDVTYEPTKDYLKEKEEQKLKALIDNRMISRDVKDATLADYDMDTPHRQQLMKESLDFLEHYHQAPYEAKGLYIHGPFGVGKTYLMSALANALVEKERIPVTMLHYPTFTNELKRSISSNQTQHIIDEVKKVSVLIIDDIGAESNSAWLRDDVLGVILEYRMKESLVTFFTSNMDYGLLEKHFAETKDDRNLLKAKRLMERIYYLTKEIELYGPNRRR